MDAELSERGIDLVITVSNVNVCADVGKKEKSIPSSGNCSECQKKEKKI